MINIIKNINGSKKSINYGTYGAVFQDGVFPSGFLTNLKYTQVGSNATWQGVDGVVQISNSVNGLADYIYKNESIGTLDRYIYRVNYKVTTLDANSQGIGIGFVSNRDSSEYLVVAILTDSINLGKLRIWRNGGILYTSTSSINISANDELSLEISANGEERQFNITAYNITQEETLAYNDYFIGSFSAYCAIWSLGGSCEMSYFGQISDEITNPDYCVIGDSISNRSGSDKYHEFQYLLKKELGGQWVTYAGGGDVTWQVSANINQITKINPSVIFLMIGTNDFNDGRPYNDVRDDHQQAVADLVALGKTVIIQELIPFTGKNYTTWNNDLRTWYPNHKIISLYDELGGNTPNPTYYIEDLIHLNNTGHAYVKNLIQNQL